MLPVKSLSLVDQVADRVRHHIAANGLQPGDALPSAAELGQILDVSRGVVREAMQLLEASGIIEVSNGRRPVVRRLEPVMLAATFDHGLATRQFSVGEVGAFRRTIECETAALAALKRTDAEATHLLELAAEMEGSIDDPHRFTDFDLAFHATLAEACGNPVFALTGRALTLSIREMIQGGLAAIRERAEWDRVVATHRGIAEAVHAGEADNARRLMRLHFDDAITRLRV